MSHYIDENGQLFVNELTAYAALKGGVLHVMGRSPDEATFYQVSLAVGLVQYENPEVLDDEGNVLTSASGALVPITGATITGIGKAMTSPPVFDGEVEVTPPAFDERFHFNFWLDSNLVANGTWETWLTDWMDTGLPVANSNKSERAKMLNDIELVDPLSVNTPINVLL